MLPAAGSSWRLTARQSVVMQLRSEYRMTALVQGSLGEGERANEVPPWAAPFNTGPSHQNPCVKCQPPLVLSKQGPLLHYWRSLSEGYPSIPFGVCSLA